MNANEPGVTWSIDDAPAIDVHGMTVVPRARILHVRWPGGGWVWNQPHSVQVTRAGVVSETPIVDVTLVAIVALRAVAVLAAAAATLWMVRGLLPRGRRNSHE
ncbi:MAG: hypothetical protein R3A10_08335 [Caldilineaceae bacterium]